MTFSLNFQETEDETNSLELCREGCIDVPLNPASMRLSIPMK